ncbi:hypothetical protein V8E54_001354 [Elaphomyces granulatus]
MEKEPWLDALTDDWISQPASQSSSPRATSIHPSARPSRRSSLSRIPLPSHLTSQASPRSGDRRDRMATQSPQTPIPAKSAGRWRVPQRQRGSVPDISSKTTERGKRSPPRTPSTISLQPEEPATVQIKPGKGDNGGATPEWRKRLVRGDMPANEQGDLFAPRGIESIFKPPPSGAAPAPQGSVPASSGPTESVGTGQGQESEEATIARETRTAGGKIREGESRSPAPSQGQATKEDKPRAAGEDDDGMEDVQSASPECHYSYEGLSDTDHRLRTVSGQEDLRNEGITPIFLSRSNTVDGRTTADILKSALKQLNGKREPSEPDSVDQTGTLQPATERQEGKQEGQVDEEEDEHDEENEQDEQGEQDEQDEQNEEDEQDEDPLLDDPILDGASQSLPADLSMGTPEVPSRALDFRRDGCSDEGSFQKRPPSPASDSLLPSQRPPSTPRANSKIRSSPPPPDVLSSPDSKVTSSSATRLASIMLSPTRDSDTNRTDASRMKPSGSPLKLFGHHDTFTNNKLLRRMSQFEETLEGISEGDEPLSPMRGWRRQRGNSSLPNPGRGTTNELSGQPGPRPGSQDATDPRINRFGNGQLDDFHFPEIASHHAKEVPTVIEGQGRGRGLLQTRSQWSSSPEYRRQSIRPSKNLDSTPDNPSSRFRRLSSRRNAPRPTEPTVKPRPDQDDTEVKFPRQSPAKESTPKRRRTSRRADDHRFHDPQEDHHTLAASVEGVDFIHRSLRQQDTAPPVGRPIEESLRVERPRTPSPTLPGRSSPSKSPPGKDPWTGLGKNQDDPDRLDTLPIGRSGTADDSRKGSITTQDFLNEATKIMSMIRAKGRPKTGLTSVEESEMTSPDGDRERSTEESTQENLSRPPSRDGVDLRKQRQQRELDPRVVSQLRKFEDQDDMETFMGSSVLSLRLDRAGKVTIDVEGVGDQDGEEVQRSPQDIQIRENPFLLRKRKLFSTHSNEGPVNHDDDGATVIHSLASFNSASGRSIPTSSSSSSNAKGIIQSDVISHLIPEKVNGMIYDRFNHTWIKRNASESRNRSKVDESADDPFQDIPDLSVDELEEMIQVQQFASPGRTQDTTLPAELQTKAHHSPSKVDKLDRSSFELRPRTRDGAASIPESSSVQSKVTRFTSSGPRPETRATSWGTETLTENGRPSDDLKDEPCLKDAEFEMRLAEGRTATILSQPPRAVTISFSSPLASHITYQDDLSLGTEGQSSKPYGEDSPSPPDPVDDGQMTTQQDPELFRQPRQKNSLPGQSRRRSLDGKPFTGRPISRIEEQNEDSVFELSLVRLGPAGPVVSTPISNRPEMSLAHPPSAENYSFHLSPLADFTVHQIDDPVRLELSYIAQRTHPSSVRQVHGAFALAAEDLIKHITDTEPYEPYWEHLRCLNLRQKGLITLHKLNELCGRLEELDVSENDIGQLSGAPSSLRHLKIQRNCISNLTAWGHLINLQYLDITGNELDSLDGFSGLIHLRELRANNNRIQNIDSILDLNGLLNLKLRNNALTTVDFEGAELTRLSDIDMSNNKIIEVQNIEYLPALQSLDLSLNQINRIHSGPQRNLRSLKLSNNRLPTFDASGFPSLRLLYLDKNCLSTIDGLDKCYRLETLSVREQAPLRLDGAASHFDIDLNTLKDVRKLFLSSNRLAERVLSPSRPLLTLQLLDVASCALPSLPSHFGAKFPNLRVLNLNFNALSDVKELAGMNGLSRLTLVSNRIGKLRRFCQVLNRLGRTGTSGPSSVKTVDLRGNPLTVGFYPPPISGSGRGGGNKRLESRPDHQIEQGVQSETRSTTLANFGHCADIAGPEDQFDSDKDEGGGNDLEIDDPYTVPPADMEVDQKYLSSLDESTKLRRMAVELMLYAGTGGAIQVLDGLALRPVLERRGADVDRVWGKLEELGVLKKSQSLRHD